MAKAAVAELFGSALVVARSAVVVVGVLVDAKFAAHVR
jgi:hypothetical protein